MPHYALVTGDGDALGPIELDDKADVDVYSGRQDALELRVCVHRAEGCRVAFSC